MSNITQLLILHMEVGTISKDVFKTAMRKSSEFIENDSLLDEKKITVIPTIPVLDIVNLSF